jgi:hypothetical protein
MATQEQKTASDLGDQAIKLAEELGRIAGTIGGSAESWMGRQKLTDQLTQLRDTATQMLEGLTATAERGRKAMTSAARRRGAKKAAKPAQVSARKADPARAPGKRRRRPAPTMPGVKKSDERIPKLRTAAAARQRRKSYA